MCGLNNEVKYDGKKILFYPDIQYTVKLYYYYQKLSTFMTFEFLKKVLLQC